MDSSDIATTARLLRGILERGAGRGVEPAGAPPAARGLDGLLATLCAAPGVRTAVVADAGGLTVASSGDALPAERLAACSVLLGSVLDPAGRLLGGQVRDRLTVRLGGDDAALLLRFRAATRTWHLILLHDPRVDPGGAAERAVASLAEALARRTTPGGSP